MWMAHSFTGPITIAVLLLAILLRDMCQWMDVSLPPLHVTLPPIVVEAKTGCISNSSYPPVN